MTITAADAKLLVGAAYSAIDWETELLAAYDHCTDAAGERVKRQCKTKIKRYRAVIRKLSAPAGGGSKSRSSPANAGRT